MTVKPSTESAISIVVFKINNSVQRIIDKRSMLKSMLFNFIIKEQTLYIY